MRKIKEVEADFTQRFLMSLVVDVQALAENVERVQTQIVALAKEHGVAIPENEA